VRFDEARHDHRVFETLVDLDLLVGDPVLDLVKRADTEDLAVHHRHGPGGRRARILGHDRLGGVDGDLLAAGAAGAGAGSGTGTSIPCGSRARS